MTNQVMLDAAEHRDLRIRTEASSELGDGQMACITVPSEFRRIQNEFPILFRRDLQRGTFSSLALFGFENGENLFVQNGRWEARYRPLALFIQPFLIGGNPDGERQVHIDLDHPRISTAEQGGQRPFDDLGNATPYLDAVAAGLDELDLGYRSSGDFFAALEHHELLEPFSLDIELRDGSQNRLVGYHLINEEKLRALDKVALAELHSAEYLLPIFMAVASLSNISALVARKNARLGHG